MKARVLCDWIVGQGSMWQRGDIVELEVFGDYGQLLVRDSAIELIEPILRVAEVPPPDQAAHLA